MSDLRSEIEIRLEYIEALRLAAYQSFNDRRNYEWKFALAIWTALAIITAGLVQPVKQGEAFPLHGKGYGFAGTLVGVFIVVLHIYFNHGCARANMIDRQKVRNYGDLIEEAIKLPVTPLQIEIQGRITKLPKPGRVIWWQWGHVVQICMTLLLTMVAVAIFWVRVR